MCCSLYRFFYETTNDLVVLFVGFSAKKPKIGYLWLVSPDLSEFFVFLKKFAFSRHLPYWPRGFTISVKKLPLHWRGDLLVQEVAISAKRLPSRPRVAISAGGLPYQIMGSSSWPIGFQIASWDFFSPTHVALCNFVKNGKRKKKTSGRIKRIRAWR